MRLSIGSFTSADSGAEHRLLCGHHHRLVHTQYWGLAVGDGGFPSWRPPPWVTPPGTVWRGPGGRTGDLAGASDLAGARDLRDAGSGGHGG